MGARIAITRTDRSAKELLEVAVRTKDSCSARRILAIALVLDGADRTSAARSCGMERRTLRDGATATIPMASTGWPTARRLGQAAG